MEWHRIKECANYNDYLFDVYCNKIDARPCIGCGVRILKIEGCCEFLCLLCSTNQCANCYRSELVIKN